VVRRRLSSEIVRRGLAPDLQASDELIARGRVTVGGASASNPARLVAADEPILVGDESHFVSRGGEKLAGALEDLRIEVQDLVALDLGCSTGGFTDCLLQRGCRHVFALDVGRAQLHERLRADTRVSVFEGVHVREVGRVVDVSTVQLIVVDLSFISACAAIAATSSTLSPGTSMVVLVKPQFEAPRREADRSGGVVTNPTVIEAAIQRVENCALRGGLEVVGRAQSRVVGRRGNLECFVHFRRPTRFL